MEPLTRREKDVAVLAATGQSNPEIARILNLSRGTVEQYLHRAYGKLEAENRGQLSYRLGESRK